MKIRSAVFLFLTGFSLGFSQTPESIAFRVEKTIQALQSLQTDFEQSYYSSAFTTPLKEKGRFYFRKPDWMRWEYRDPEEKVFIYKEGFLLSYFPEDNQLIRRHLSGDVSESEIFALLAGRAALKDRYTIEFSPFPTDTRNVRQLKLTPLGEEGEHSFILLEIDGKTWLILKAVFFDWGGNKQEFRFSRIQRDKPIPASLFEIKVPPDCEIIDDLSYVKKK